MKYKLIIDGYKPTFEQTVDEHLAQGWKLHGNTFVLDFQGFQFCQPMVKENELDKKDFTAETACLQCGGSVTIRQPADHSEFAPTGTCQNCGAVYAVPGYLKNDLTVLLIDQAKKAKP